jgi:multimeric flavodoxin WrbA
MTTKEAPALAGVGIRRRAMKIVAFDGSTYRQTPVGVRVQRLLDSLAAEGAETELVRLEKDGRTGCTACGRCGHRLDLKCSDPPEDGLRSCVRKLRAADAVIIGTPVYSTRGSPATQALLNRLEHDRLGRDDSRLAGKPAAVVVDPRRAGAAAVAAGVGRRLRANGLMVVAGAGPPDEGGATEQAAAGDGPPDVGELTRALLDALGLERG